MLLCKTIELKGAALNWAVATCLGYDTTHSDIRKYWKSMDGWGDDDFLIPKFSKKWKHAGPIIFDHKITVGESEEDGFWTAWLKDKDTKYWAYGPHPIVAAMRCFVFSILGDEIKVPDEKN